MSQLKSDVGGFKIILESKEERGSEVLNLIRVFPPGSSARYELEAVIYKDLYERAMLAFEQASKHEQEMSVNVAS